MPYKEPAQGYPYRAAWGRRERVSREMRGLCTMCGLNEAAIVYRSGRQTLRQPRQGKLCEPCRDDRRELGQRQREKCKYD